jgi:hypothetical protein
LSFLVTWVNGLAISTKCGTNSLQNEQKPKNALTAFIDLERGYRLTDLILLSEASVPVWDKTLTAKVCNPDICKITLFGLQLQIGFLKPLKHIS